MARAGHHPPAHATDVCNQKAGAPAALGGAEDMEIRGEASASLPRRGVWAPPPAKKARAADELSWMLEK